jgi:glycosyltransferase involved in cell wall biosynthesis
MEQIQHTPDTLCSPEVIQMPASNRGKRISFILPAYNEEETIGIVLKQLKETFGDQEIVVVDDASTDDTYSISIEAGADQVIRHNKNRGPGAAFKTGVSQATGEFIVLVDADDQHPIEEIKKVVAYVLETPAIDAVFTERRNVYSSGFIRSAGKFLISSVVRGLIGENIRDHNCGLRAFKRARIMPFLFMLPDGFSYVTTSLVLSYKEDFCMHWIDINMKQRNSGKSQVKVRHGFNTFLLVFRLIVNFDPMKFFIPLAGLSFFIGILTIIYGMISYGGPGKNYIFFFLFGSLVFVLGLLSEQISILRKEILNLKPKK